jgi:hypothetical protein
VSKYPLLLLRRSIPKFSSQVLEAAFFSFDISGRVTGFGNPDWLRTHTPAGATSPFVLASLAAGATSVGKTVMDEMAYR